MTELTRRSPADVTAFAQLAPADQRRVRALVAESLAPSTRRSYESHLAGWMTWCRRNGYSPLPADPATVAAYLSFLAERPAAEGGKVRPSSIKAIKSAISTAHNLAGHSNPTTAAIVVRTLQGIDRKHQGGRVMNRARALTGDEVVAMAGTTRGEGKELVDKRDAAIMLAAYGIAARRSEVVALDVEDLERRRTGWIAHIRRGKTDQTGIGKEADVPTEAADAIRAWLTAAGITAGPIFRRFAKNSTRVLPRRLSAQSFNLIAKQRADLAGIDASHGPRISGHSFRRGAASTLAENAGTIWEVRRLGRWETMNTPGKYVDDQQKIPNLSERLELKKPAPADAEATDTDTD